MFELRVRKDDPRTQKIKEIVDAMDPKWAYLGMSGEITAEQRKLLQEFCGTDATLQAELARAKWFQAAHAETCYWFRLAEMQWASKDQECMAIAAEFC